ncbi:MAG: hypothetical protein ACOC80_00765 [Petrotogales bacterium]
MKTNVDIADPIRKRLNKYLERVGGSMKEVINIALDDYLRGKGE